MIRVTIKDKQTGIQKEVQMSRTLAGDYILREHPEIDIIVMPQKNKLLTLPKEEYNDLTYSIQNNFFKYMTKKGVIIPESIVGGNIFGSLQAAYVPTPPGGENPLQVTLI